MTDNERQLERSGYDNWKLSNQDDEQSRKRVGMGGKWGTIEYEYIVQPIGKCPCCNEDILEDNLFVEENGTLFHFSCYNYKKKQEEEDKRNGN